MEHTGPLAGVRVVELAGKGPGPFGTMVMADLGADVVRIDRPGADAQGDVVGRGKRSIVLDLKQPEEATIARRLVDTADVLVDPFRPGVLERLGLQPDECLRSNPRLVVARVTGWGQEGALAATAGHDIDYIAVAGALHPLGGAALPPRPPLNLIGDFGGGGMLLAVGVLAALLERAQSGRGQVIDVAMVDGVALLLADVWGRVHASRWSDDRGGNWLDGAAPWYRSYATADGKFVAVGAVEERFYDAFLRRLGLDPEEWPQHDDRRWASLSRRLEEIFRVRTRAAWWEHFAGVDACLAPVLSPVEAPSHQHLASRRTYVEHRGLIQPAPAPRFSRTPASLTSGAPRPGEHTSEILAELG